MYGSYVVVKVACTVLIFVSVVQSSVTVIVVLFVLVLTLRWLKDEQKAEAVEMLSRME